MASLLELDDAAAKRLLARIRADMVRIGDELLPRFLADAGEIMATATKERFGTKRSPDGEPWAPWSDRYARRQAAHPQRSLLVRTGDLEDDVQRDVAADQVQVGAAKEYAAAMQWGWEEIPPRPYLGFSDDDVADIDALMEELLVA